MVGHRSPRLRKSVKNHMATIISSFSWGDVFFVLNKRFFAFSGLGRHLEGAVGFGHFGGAIENFQVGPKNAQIAPELRSKFYTFLSRQKLRAMRVVV